MRFGDNPIIYLTRKLWAYSAGNRRNVVFYTLLFIGANVASFFEPLIVGYILNLIQQNGLNTDSLPLITATLSLFIVVEVVFWCFHGPARVLETKNAFLARANYKRYLIDGVMSLPSAWHTEHHSGDTIDRVEKGTRALHDYATDTFLVIEMLVRFTASYLALVYFNFHAGYIVFFMLLTTIFLILRFDKILVKQYFQLNRSENKISEKIYDAISNITTVIILRIEKLISKSVWSKIIKPFGLFAKNSKINEIKWFLVSLCTAVMTFLVLFTFIYFNIKNGTVILVGTIYVLYGYVNRINELFFRFAYMYGDIVRQKTAVMNAEELAQDFVEREKVKNINLRGKDWRSLDIRRLNFSYHTKEGAMPHLHDVSLSLARGQRVALIGDSGSGKTTILKIIRGLYPYKQGKVYLDGVWLKKGFHEISENIALIPQEPEIFATTIKDNITVGVDRKLEDIKRYTDLVNLTTTIESLPKKFDSSVVEKGVNLSGGEKQRLALARGLLASEDKDILLLDEPTSSVDAINELNIYQRVFEVFKDKTIVSSIHRLHLLGLFDVVYFFENGRIIAWGSFKELLKSSPRFMEWWQKYNKENKR